MIEAMLWTMAEPLLAEQLPGVEQSAMPGVVWRCAGPDDWVAATAPMAVDGSDARETASEQVRLGFAAAALARSADLVTSEHLRSRGFSGSRLTRGSCRGCHGVHPSDTLAVPRRAWAPIPTRCYETCWGWPKRQFDGCGKAARSGSNPSRRRSTTVTR